MKTEKELSAMSVAELRKLASKNGIKNAKRFPKDQLIAMIGKASQKKEVIVGTETVIIGATDMGGKTTLIDVESKNDSKEGEEVVERQKPPIEREEIDRIKALDRSKSEKFRMLFTRGMRACDIATEFGAHYSFVYGAIQRMQ